MFNCPNQSNPPLLPDTTLFQTFLSLSITQVNASVQNETTFLYFSFSASNCGSILYGPSGSFQSTNFPNNYPNNEYCTWEIQVPQGKKVLLDFEELRTEENKDFVFIYDTGKTDPVIAFSGIKDKPRAITSSGNSIRVRFVSNGEYANNGFKVSYKQTGKISSKQFFKIKKSIFIVYFCLA